MKKHNLVSIALILFSCISFASFAQTAAAKKDLVVKLHYFNNNNQMQYLVADAKTKVDGKFQVVPGVTLRFFISGDTSAANYLGSCVTNAKGKALLLIPALAKQEWNKSVMQSFQVISPATKEYEDTKADVSITKAKIKIDTLADRKITAVVMELKDTVWTPVKGVDLKVAIRRLGGDLNVSETQTYTSDSLGMVNAEFKRDSLPGDTKGILTLVAKTEDNDTYGNISAEIPAAWGVPTIYNSPYDRRTLFARRGHSPIWLELMAYSIIVAVWGVLIYLFIQVRKLKKIGLSA